MATSQEIETKRLLIVPFCANHITERYLGWLKDPETVRYSDQRYHKHSLESCRRYLSSFNQSPNYFWAVFCRDERLAHIGTLTAYIDSIHLVADVGILIGERRVWGRGYGTEAWIAVCNWLFCRTDIRKITAGTISPNTGMLGIMKKAEMIDDGRRIRHCLWEGKEVDVIHKALFRDEWLARQRNEVL